VNSEHANSADGKLNSLAFRALRYELWTSNDKMQTTQTTPHATACSDASLLPASPPWFAAPSSTM